MMRIVSARSAALMPVVMPRAASTLTWKSVLNVSRFCRTMRSMPELLQPLGGGRHANQPAPVLGHEIDRRRRHELRRHDQVALVLAVGIVHHDHHLALPQVGDDGFDGIEPLCHRPEQLIRACLQLEIRKRNQNGEHPSSFVGADVRKLTFPRTKGSEPPFAIANAFGR